MPSHFEVEQGRRVVSKLGARSCCMKRHFEPPAPNVRPYLRLWQTSLAEETCQKLKDEVASLEGQGARADDLEEAGA